jgi:hypothetical protein
MCDMAERAWKQEKAVAKQKQKKLGWKKEEEAAATGAKDKRKNPSQQRIDQYVKDAKAPDRSRAGRAETFAGLVLVWHYHRLLRQCDVEHDSHIEQLRKHYGPGMDCGNGYTSIRPAAYYEALWLACLRYLAQRLEIHEVTLLGLSARWIDLPKVVGTRMPMHYRLDPRIVMNANPETVKNTCERRTEILNARLMADGRSRHLAKGPRYWPTSTGEKPGGSGGNAPGERSTAPAHTHWTTQQLREPKGRPDNPTYIQMIVFDHLLDYVPDQHEKIRGQSGRGGGGGRGGLHPEGAKDGTHNPVQDLSDRMQQLMLGVTEAAQANPERSIRHHTLPMGPTSSTTTTTNTPTKRDRQAPPLDLPCDDTAQGESSKRARTAQDVPAAAAGGGRGSSDQGDKAEKGDTVMQD